MHPPSPKVLVAPLDWGLGHATRCVPVVRELIRQGATVLLAAEGKTEVMLRLEFPQLRFLRLPGYRMEYAASGWEMALKVVAQIPKMLSAIKREQAWLQKVVEEEGLDAVMSDNRYGLSHPHIHSVFITHQLLVKAPVRLAEDALQEFIYGYIERFDECWVPDAQGEDNLAGLLSHPVELPTVPLRYMGTLSRFAQARQPAVEGDYLLILLSGPEPQRTLLESKLLDELKEYPEPVVLVRGLPDETANIEVNDNLTVFNHLPAAELEQQLTGAKWVMARSGYSTVMDLAVLKKRSILIPTPGQTEQEYLAEHLMRKNFALCISQKKFRLRHALALAEDFAYEVYDNSDHHLSSCVRSLLERVSKGKNR